MAFNPRYLSGPRTTHAPPVAAATSEESLDVVHHEESILSDSEASLWVLFNPTEGSDILLLSNGTVTGTDNEQTGSGQSVEDDTGDSLIEGLSPLPSQARLERLFAGKSITQPTRLDQRIDQWRNEHASSELVDDNTASWDLDEDLQSDFRSESQSEAGSAHTITDRPPNKRPFYGDELVRKMSQKQFRKMKRAAGRLAPHLTRQQLQTGLPLLLNQLITRLLRLPEFGLEFNLQNHSYQLLIETMLENPRPVVPITVEYSDTASLSSMIRCGGWGDI